jgi:hypothetical protein
MGQARGVAARPDSSDYRACPSRNLPIRKIMGCQRAVKLYGMDSYAAVEIRAASLVVKQKYGVEELPGSRVRCCENLSRKHTDDLRGFEVA